MADIKKCPSCSSNELKLFGTIPPSSLFAGRILDRLLDGGNLYKCLSCCIFFRSPHSSTQELNSLYASGSTNNWSTDVEERADWCLIRDWITKNDAVKYVLDVGCYDGRLLHSLGPEVTKYGVEINETAASYAKSKGVIILGDDFSELGNFEPTVDVVIAADVIEHSPDPKQFLSNLASAVKEGGHILITTGNTDSVSWRLMGSKYWYCFIAEHLSFINPSWVKHVAPQMSLQIEQVKFFSHAHGSIGLKVRIYELMCNLVLRFAPSFFAFLRHQGLGGIDVQKRPELEMSPPSWMSARDHMFVVLRKLRST